MGRLTAARTTCDKTPDADNPGAQHIRARRDRKCEVSRTARFALVRTSTYCATATAMAVVRATWPPRSVARSDPHVHVKDREISDHRGRGLLQRRGPRSPRSMIVVDRVRPHAAASSRIGSSCQPSKFLNVALAAAAAFASSEPGGAYRQSTNPARARAQSRTGVCRGRAPACSSCHRCSGRGAPQ